MALTPIGLYTSVIGLAVRLVFLGALGLGVLVLLGDAGLLDGLARSLVGF
ncbi:hypothetical protein [Halorubrum coriense]|nr:hypothetical protein [Halorubrum coriense]